MRAAVTDRTARHRDVRRARPLVANGQHILRTVTARRKRHRQGARVKVTAVHITHGRIAALVKDLRPVPFGVGQRIAPQVGEDRDVIDSSHGHVDRPSIGPAISVVRRVGKLIRNLLTGCETIELSIGVVGETAIGVKRDQGSRRQGNRITHIGSTPVDLTHHQRVAVDIDVIDENAGGCNIQRGILVSGIANPCGFL